METGITNVDVVFKMEDLVKEYANPFNIGSRWFYPTYPETKANLPQVTYELSEDGEYVPVGDDNFLCIVHNTDGTIEETYGRRYRTKMNLWVYTHRNKDKVVTVTLPDESVHTIYGKAANEYVKGIVSYLVNSTLDEWKDIFYDFDLINEEKSFDDGKYFWTSRLQYRVEYMETWKRVYGKADPITGIAGKLITDSRIEVKTEN